MKKNTTSLMLSVALFSAAAVTAGCSSAPAPSSGTGGTSGGGGGGNAGGNLAGVLITPDATGWVMGDTNSLMVQGAWYPYGDGLGPDGTAAGGTCVMAGHQVSECSMITSPAPGMFTNTGGMMCTRGTVAKVLNGANAMPDYASMWGAGIGLDLNSSGGPISTKGVFNATAKLVKGISFDLSAVPLPGLRVEFPTTSTTGSAAGADYWGATATYANSPVVMGTNTILWADVKGPGPTANVFKPTEILSIQFHVPTGTTAAGTYDFCISNLKMLM